LIKFDNTLRYESSRLLTLLLGTFENKQIWRDAAPLQRCLEMSADGLYLDIDDEHPDRVVCAFCRLELTNWDDANERAHSAHQRYNRGCRFVEFLDNNSIYHHNIKFGDEQILGMGHDATPSDREFQKN
jgi:hypothetical protein